jgi:hypothetical protein
LTIIQPASGNALQSTINNDNLAWLIFRNLWFAKGTNLTGESTNMWMGYNLFFDNCYFTAGDCTFKNLAYPTFWGNTRFGGSGNLKFSNVTQVTMNPYVEIGSGVTSFTIETDQSGGIIKTPKDWTTGTRIIMMGCSSSKDLIWSLINITTWTGTAIQFRYARFGSSGHTIPANASMLVYNGTLVGNYINNGTLSLYGGNITGTLTNNATLNLYHYCSIIKNDSSVIGTSVKDALNNLLRPYLITTTNATYSLDTEKYLHVNYAGICVVTLPTAVGRSGQSYHIKNLTTNSTTVNTTGGQTIDGAASISIVGQYTSVMLVSDGSNWFIH